MWHGTLLPLRSVGEGLDRVTLAAVRTKERHERRRPHPTILSDGVIVVATRRCSTTGPADLAEAGVQPDPAAEYNCWIVDDGSGWTITPDDLALQRLIVGRAVHHIDGESHPDKEPWPCLQEP
jgi:hypothetical protein